MIGEIFRDGVRFLYKSLGFLKPLIKGQSMMSILYKNQHLATFGSNTDKKRNGHILDYKQFMIRRLVRRCADWIMSSVG